MFSRRNKSLRNQYNFNSRASSQLQTVTTSSRINKNKDESVNETYDFIMSGPSFKSFSNSKKAKKRVASPSMKNMVNRSFTNS
jgi:hypothetical protein